MGIWGPITLTALAALSVLSSCGIFESEYIDYTEESEATVDTTSACATAAIESFETEMQPGIKSNCSSSGCHLSHATTPLSPTDTTTNRNELTEYANGSAETLFNKVSTNGVSHSGGDRSADISEANIEAWISAEAECL